MNIKPVHSLSQSLLLLSGLLLGSTAIAVEQIYHGSSCENIYPPDGTLAQNIYHSITGLYFGDPAIATGSSRYIVCPLNRFNVTNTNGIRNIEVTVNNRSGAMWCGVASQDRFGGYIRSITRTPAPGRQILSWGDSVNASVAYGSYSVFCVLGRGDGIYTIRLDEY